MSTEPKKRRWGVGGQVKISLSSTVQPAQKRAGCFHSAVRSTHFCFGGCLLVVPLGVKIRLVCFCKPFSGITLFSGKMPIIRGYIPELPHFPTIK